MPKSREVICRNPKCGTTSRIFVEETQPLPASGYYVFPCPRCKKLVPFPASGLQQVETIPGQAILVTALV